MSLGVAILCGILYWLAEANLPFVGLWTIRDHSFVDSSQVVSLDIR